MINITQHREAPWELLRRRLEAGVGLPLDEVPIEPLLAGVRRSFPAGVQISSAEGDSRLAYLIASGVAGHARVLIEGRRQIVSLRLPGDIVLGDTREAVLALTPVEVVDALAFIRRLGESDADWRLRRAWVAACSVEQDRLRDQVVRLGRLSAYERMAHFLLETHERLLHVGLATPQAFHLPLRQDAVSDLLGLSVVHLSRVTQQLRRDRLAQTRNNYVNLLDPERLLGIGAYVSRFRAVAGPSPLTRSAQQVAQRA